MSTFVVAPVTTNRATGSTWRTSNLKMATVARRKNGNSPSEE